MFILKKEHQPGVYVPLRALFLVYYESMCFSLLHSSGLKIDIKINY